MAEKKSRVADYILLFLLTTAIVGLLAYMLGRYHLNDEVTFEPDKGIVANPLMGYAPYAENVDKCQDTDLVFIKLKWSDWEPEMGQYDTAFLESKFHIPQWKAQGKHAVIRFVCDDPDTDGGADIPGWLLESTGDGTYYSGSSGSGYSPNYENEFFRSRHTMAVTALADYFNQDDFAAYVELGSLGHWGEWHARDNDGNSLMPSSETCWDYILAYTEHFQNVRFLMRRSYIYAVDARLGIYNDVLGDQAQTDRWLEWTRSGGSQATSVDEIEIQPYPNFWETAPAGGEITSGIDESRLYNEDLSSLLRQLEDCHLTFVGPHIPDAETNAYDSVLRRVGYKYYVSRLSTTFSFADDSIDIRLDWENDGSAPLYWDWPVMIKIFDHSGTLVYWETLDLKLSQLAPGKTITTVTKVPYLDEIRDGLSVGISIRSYDGKDSVMLAMDMDREIMEDSQIIYSYSQK